MLHRFSHILPTLFVVSLALIETAHAQGGLSTTGMVPTREVFPDTWVAIDGLGRNMANADLAGAPKPKRTVGMFYYIWHNNAEVRDNSRILKQYPEIAAQPQDPAVWEKYGFTNEGRPRHHWGEPLFGYYASDDEWVIRKHAQMLCDAGVDTIIFDTSNVDARNKRDLSKHYIQNALTVCRVFSEIRAGGGRAPAFVFLTNGDGGRSASVIQWLYDNLYSKNLYRNAWFSWPDFTDGNKIKPLILGYDWETTPEMRQFFNIRFSWAFDNSKRPKAAPGAGTRARTFPWTDSYPQRPGTGATPQDLQSLSIAVDNGPIYAGLGRSSRDNRSELSSRNLAYPGIESKYGLYYGEQWDRVWTGNAPWVEPERRFEGIPPFLFLTQWNEWTASRWDASQHPLPATSAVPDRMVGQTLSAGDSYFVDEFNAEYSRDSEPDRSGTGDNYYWQTVDNIRRYKGVHSVQPASAPLDFALTNFAVWPQVGPEYLDDSGDTFSRINAKGLGVDHSIDPKSTTPIVYNNRTGRNDFLSAKVALGNDGTLTFWVTTKTPITATRDVGWMNLWLRDRNAASQHWSGFSYRIAPNDAGAMRLWAYDGKGNDWKWKDVGVPVSVQVQGNQMALRVAARDLGFVANQPLDFAFKWSDNVVPSTPNEPDPTDWFINGDTAPNGRFAYRFHTIADAAIPVSFAPVSGQLYALQNRKTNLVLQLLNTTGSARAEGTRLKLVPLNPTTRPDVQQWVAERDGTTTGTAVGNPIVRFQSFDCGHSLGGAYRIHREKSDNLARVWRSDDPSLEVQWEVQPASDGTFRLVHRATGKALGAGTSANADGSDTDNAVRLVDVKAGDSAQEWRLIPQRNYK